MRRRTDGVRLPRSSAGREDFPQQGNEFFLKAGAMFLPTTGIRNVQRDALPVGTLFHAFDVLSD